MSSELDGYAYFNITSTQPLEKVVNHMGVVGDGRCWSNGNPRFSKK